MLLVGRQRDFVDVTDPTDSYGPEVWSAVAEYFEKLPDAEMVLPGGRYSCAQVLAARGLPFLEGRSLGEVCLGAWGGRADEEHFVCGARSGAWAAE